RRGGEQLTAGQAHARIVAGTGASGRRRPSGDEPGRRLGRDIVGQHRPALAAVELDPAAGALGRPHAGGGDRARRAALRPAAGGPTSGRTVEWLGGASSTTAPRRERPPSITSSARGLVASRLMRPALASFSRWAWTVDGDVSPTAWPISRTVGGYPCWSTCV